MIQISKEEIINAFNHCKTKKELSELFNNKSSITRFAKRLANQANLNVDDYFTPKRNDSVSKIKCLNCGKEFEALTRKKRQFCSIKCSNDYRKNNEFYECLNCGKKVKKKTTKNK